MPIEHSTGVKSPAWARAVWRLPVIAGLAVLGVPTLVTLGQQVWSTEAGAHGPIVFATGIWLVARQADEFREGATHSNVLLTVLMVVASLCLYVFGRAYDYISLETAGLYGACISVMYSYFGLPVLIKNWFPFLYLAFLVPPPGWLMDSLTAPLKEFVSFAACSIMQLAGIPVFREGVTLTVAQYQLLVEDACSGMNSLIGLVAISLFYIYLLRNASWRYSLLLASFVIPIAILANILRIIVLVLLTYFVGDGAAQGFLHITAGLFLFATALILVFAVDNIISSLLKPKGAIR